MRPVAWKSASFKTRWRSRMKMGLGRRGNILVLPIRSRSRRYQWPLLDLRVAHFVFWECPDRNPRPLRAKVLARLSPSCAHELVSTSLLLSARSDALTIRTPWAPSTLLAWPIADEGCARLPVDTRLMSCSRHFPRLWSPSGILLKRKILTPRQTTRLPFGSRAWDRGRSQSRHTYFKVVEMMPDIRSRRLAARHGTLVGRRMVTSCRDIFFILRTTSALRTSEAVTCPMIAQLGVRPRG
jgi:hypothetical protein